MRFLQYKRHIDFQTHDYHAISEKRLKILLTNRRLSWVEAHTIIQGMKQITI